MIMPSFLARRAGLATLNRAGNASFVSRRAFASEAGALAGPSFKLSEDQEAYQGMCQHMVVGRCLRCWFYRSRSPLHCREHYPQSTSL